MQAFYHHQSGRNHFDGQTKNMDDRIANHKYIHITAKKDMDVQPLRVFGPVNQDAGNSCVVEVDNGKVQAVLSRVYELFEIEDLSVENIPLEEAISAIYQNGGNQDA